jgi:ubiquinone/menaquinone biosynthesis C-methylase UbiE
MWDLPYKDGEVDFIFSSQALEHVSKYAIAPTLIEWNRVLRHEGGLQLQVPDLVWASLHWVSAQNNDWSLDTIYGNQRHEGEYHKTGFSEILLKNYFGWVGGFEIISIEYFGGTIEDALNWEELSKTGHLIQRSIELKAIKSGPTNFDGMEPVGAPPY